MFNDVVFDSALFRGGEDVAPVETAVADGAHDDVVARNDAVVLDMENVGFAGETENPAFGIAAAALYPERIELRLNIGCVGIDEVKHAFAVETLEFVAVVVIGKGDTVLAHDKCRFVDLFCQSDNFLFRGGECVRGEWNGAMGTAEFPEPCGDCVRRFQNLICRVVAGTGIEPGFLENTGEFGVGQMELESWTAS